MFYKQFLRITNILNPEFVEKFDYWLATLPKDHQKNITASVVSSRLEVHYTLAETILQFAEREKILEKHFLIRCPDCEHFLDRVDIDELPDILTGKVFCEECEEEKSIRLEDIYTTYSVVIEPDVSEEELRTVIERKLGQTKLGSENFSKADSLQFSTVDLYNSFYSPDESAYKRFSELRDRLDLDYGKNTTAKGAALEALALRIFKEIKGIKGTNKIKTQTNQFDCTCISNNMTNYHTVFRYLSPYFIIECKNEKKKPDTNYCNKLLSIMETNEAQLGIIFARQPAAKTCFTLSREHYLEHRRGEKQQILITMSDEDLKFIIDDRVNLLDYLNFKIMQITAGTPNSQYSMLE